VDLKAFSYKLPRGLIAQYPNPRGSERLCVVDKAQGLIFHCTFDDMHTYLSEKDCVVLNNTRVIPARLLGRKETGGAVEVLLLKKLSPNKWECMMKASKPSRPGANIFFDDDLKAKVGSRHDNTYEVEFSDPKILQDVGRVPLPPYINRDPQPEDCQTYQTVYAKYNGSVAAPTAGLHFTDEYLGCLQDKGVGLVYITMHVGPGTFLPVRTDNIEDHHMHTEEFRVTQKAARDINRAIDLGKRIIAVGTTTTRVLEHLMLKAGKILPGDGTTDLFLRPGSEFRCISGLLTNFHLPCSTLLMLVCAFGGYDLIMRAYQEAIERGYRFFSYGDAMFIF